MQTVGSPLLWAIFGLLVIVALLVDLLVMRRGGAHEVSFREALAWSIGWIVLALGFNAALWWWVSHSVDVEAGNRIGLEFLTGYLVEKSLAVDNIFVFLMLFNYFAVPQAQRQRVLILGVLGAIALRGILILAGAMLLARFHWVLYVFGAFLTITGIKMLIAAGKAPDLEANPILRWMRGHLPLTPDYHGAAMSVHLDGKRWFTPLFAVVVLIGVTDVIFAVDSIPAIFAITQDPFVVLTSNVFAVLGLRALFFLLQGLVDRFHLLPYGLALILVFIGAKMLLIDVFPISVLVSLAIVSVILATTVILSLRRPAPPTA